MNHFSYSLDLETAGDEPGFGLQPYRALCDPPRAWITCCAVADLAAKRCVLTTENYQAELDKLAGQRVVGWNMKFDIAWLIATGHDVSKIKWFDAMLLWKWVLNSQRTDGGAWRWSLEHAVEYYAKYLPGAAKFIEMKKNAPADGIDDIYWKKRAKADTVMTVLLGNLLWERLSTQQKRSAAIEATNLVPVARGWLMGIYLDMDMVEAAAPSVTQGMEDIELRLGVHNAPVSGEPQDHAKWAPSAILRSPKKLANLLYEVWKLPVEFRSEKTGEPSTHKAALTYLADRSDLCLEILAWRKLNTELTKFIQGFRKSVNYLNMGDRSYPEPKLFATKTGRQTYSSKTRAEF